MFANSLSGGMTTVGGPATLRVVTSQSYSTTTGRATKTSTDYAITNVVLFQVRDRDRKSGAGALARASSEMVYVLAGSLPAGIVPRISDQWVINGRVFVTNGVRRVEARGVPVGYECEVSGQ